MGNVFYSIDNFLKFEKMEYLIHHVKAEMWPAMCKFPIFFSAVKLKACVRYFLRNFYSSPNDRPLKTMKDVFCVI